MMLQSFFDGKIQYACLPNKKPGGIVDDFIDFTE
jgi:hypothetical protein